MKLKQVKARPLNHDDRMPFGEHRGRLMEEVPAGYLIFVADKHWIRKFPGVKAYVDKNREWLEVVAEEERAEWRERMQYETHTEHEWGGW